jgi:hypothetical protein
MDEEELAHVESAVQQYIWSGATPELKEFKVLTF